METEQYIKTYKDHLINQVMPFWLNHSIDQKYGGYFTCLRQDGSVYDTDKFMWLQGRQVWTLASMYHRVEENPLWKKAALQGARFMLEKGRDRDGNWYFSLTREGKPLMQAYNIFSDCFAAMGLGALYKIAPEPEYAEVARTTFSNILERRTHPKGRYDKSFPGTRPLKSFALPMILSNLSLELEHILDAGIIDTLLQEVIHEVMEVFYHPESGMILEHVNPDGSFNDSFDGRLVNPGHVLEAMWFIMDLAVRRQDDSLMEKCVKIALRAMEYGWDPAYEGIFYFMDVKGNPQQQLEWDQKLWWVHIEAMIAMLKGYQHTGNMACWQWFERLHAYCQTRFVDETHGEWFGYLNRQGEVLLPLKGGKWKGCFHVPRGMYQIWKTLEQIQTNSSTKISI